MNTHTTVVVSIGRNVGDVPMPAREWEDFIESVTFQVDALRGDIVGRARGKGEWDGGSEDSYMLIALFPTALIPHLRRALALQAHIFNQEAVGLVVNDKGTDSLVKAGWR